MEGFKEAILYIRQVNKTFQYERKELLRALKYIFCQAMESGLDDTSMRILADTLKTTNLPLICFDHLVECLIPKTYVAESVVVDIALWLLSKKPDVKARKIVPVLRWLTGIVYHGLLKTDKLENFYDLFFNMLRRPGIQQHVCALIQSLTKSHYITRRHVLILTDLQKSGGNKHLESLLGLLKYLKPQLVPDYISVCHPSSASTWDASNHGFLLAKERCALQDNTTTSMEIVSYPSSHHAKIQRYQSIVPQIMYLDLCRDHSQAYKLGELDGWESIGACSVDLEMPIQSLALLRCPFGMFSLAFGGSEIQRRFSLNLQSKLHTVFLEIENEITSWTPEERSRSEALLLSQVSTLQEYLHQPVPVISSFLSKYLPLWDGDSHRMLVLRLLTYLNFYSFEELESCVLDPLSILFITKDVEFKCNVINALKEFTKNLILKELWRKGKEPLFLGVKRSWRPEDVYPKIFEFTSDLIETGISSENGDSFLLYTALSYYHWMATLQKEIGINYLVIPPPAVMYFSLFSYNLTCLSLACSLLVRYKVDIYPLLEDQLKVKESLGNLSVYAVDYVNFLCTDEPFSNRTRSYIFGNLKDTTIKACAKLVNVESLSGICNHIAFAPYHFIYSQSNTPTNYAVLSKTAEKKFPGIYEFLKIFGGIVT